MENLTKLLDAEKRQKSLHSRTGMSRHSRFGTTVAVRAVSCARRMNGRLEADEVGRPENSIAQAECHHRQSGQDTRCSEAQTSRKAEEGGEFIDSAKAFVLADDKDELGRVINLSPDAMRVLQDLAKSFIQSCFNSTSRVSPQHGLTL